MLCFLSPMLNTWIFLSVHQFGLFKLLNITGITMSVSDGPILLHN